MIKTIAALVFSFLLGASLSFVFFYHATHYVFWELVWEFWAVVAVASATGLGISLYLSRTRPEMPPIAVEKNNQEVEKLREEFNNFQKEVKQAMRGHLKVSILFWTYFYKKEKIKTFEEAKKEVFQDLKREFPHIRWVESMLEDIRQELIKYSK